MVMTAHIKTESDFQNLIGADAGTCLTENTFRRRNALPRFDIFRQPDIHGAGRFTGFAISAFLLLCTNF
jgi:hypothetical protein